MTEINWTLLYFNLFLLDVYVPGTEISFLIHIDDRRISKEVGACGLEEKWHKTSYKDMDCRLPKNNAFFVQNGDYKN